MNKLAGAFLLGLLSFILMMFLGEALGKLIGINDPWKLIAFIAVG